MSLAVVGVSPCSTGRPGNEVDLFMLRNSYIDVMLYILQEVIEMLKEGRSLVADVSFDKYIPLAGISASITIS